MIQVPAAAPFELAHSPDAQQLARVVSRWRLRLGLERTFRWVVRGVALGAATAMAISLTAWLADASLTYWAVLAPVVVALATGLAKWPSRIAAAREADGRLALEERLATAVELTHRSAHGRFDALQLKDAVGALQTSRPTLAMRIDGRELTAALVLSGLAILSLVLPAMPRPGFATHPNEPLALQALIDDDAQARAAIADLDPTQANPAQPALQAQPQPQDVDLASRVEAEQAEREALDRLSQALGKVSAGQPAADAIQRGDFASAKDLLSNLAEEADQLSDAAKQQLGRALQQAAGATTSTDRALADRERAAAAALSKPNYAEQRQALRSLADQIEKSGARSATDDQMAHDAGRLQQQQSSAAGQSGQTGAQSSQGANGPPSQQSAGAGGNIQGGAGDQGGAGAGTGPGGDPRGDQTNQLDGAGQSVQVPVMLGNGPGVRPTDGTEDQLSNDPTAGGRSVSELVQSQQTGQVAPEQNLVPGEQRPVVRGYFH